MHARPRPEPSCAACRHSYVTWDPERPRGCRAYGFQSRRLPSEVVKQSSGMPCQLFEERRKQDNRARP